MGGLYAHTMHTHARTCPHRLTAHAHTHPFPSQELTNEVASLRDQLSRALARGRDAEGALEDMRSRLHPLGGVEGAHALQRELSEVKVRGEQGVMGECIPSTGICRRENEQRMAISRHPKNSPL